MFPLGILAYEMLAGRAPFAVPAFLLPEVVAKARYCGAAAAERGRVGAARSDVTSA